MKLLLRKLHYISIDGRRMLGIVHLNFVEKSSFNFGGNFKFTLLLLYDMGVSCHRHFFLVLLLHQQWFPPLRLQASYCSTFRIMCDVPSIAVFCSESIECFPGTASKFFFKLLFTIPVARIIIGTIVHFRFHIHCICIHKLLYFNFFSASFCTTLLLLSLSVNLFCCNTGNIIRASCYLMWCDLTVSFLPVRVCFLLLDSFSLRSCAVSIISLMTILP